MSEAAQSERLRWEDFRGDPGDELCELLQAPPDADAPVQLWMSWHERTIVCWEQVAARDEIFADTAAFLGDYHRRRIKELLEDPSSRGRRGWWPP